MIPGFAAASNCIRLRSTVLPGPARKSQCGGLPCDARSRARECRRDPLENPGRFPCPTNSDVSWRFTVRHSFHLLANGFDVEIPTFLAIALVFLAFSFGTNHRLDLLDCRDPGRDRL